MVNYKETSFNTNDIIKDVLLLRSAAAATIFHNQITEIPLKISVTVPDGYIGIAIPIRELQLRSSVLIEGSGYILPSIPTTSLVMRKGTSGSVKIQIGDPIAYLVIQKIEPVSKFDDSKGAKT